MKNPTRGKGKCSCAAKSTQGKPGVYKKQPASGSKSRTVKEK